MEIKVNFLDNLRLEAKFDDFTVIADQPIRYKDIKAPTIIIAGDTDNVVSTEIHSKHLARNVPGAELIIVHNLGHKSDFVARDLAIAAMEKIAGKKRNLKALARTLEMKIAGDGTKG